MKSDISHNDDRFRRGGGPGNGKDNGRGPGGDDSGDGGDDDGSYDEGDVNGDDNGGGNGHDNGKDNGITPGDNGGGKRREDEEWDIPDMIDDGDDMLASLPAPSPSAARVEAGGHALPVHAYLQFIDALAAFGDKGGGGGEEDISDRGQDDIPLAPPAD